MKIKPYYKIYLKPILICKNKNNLTFRIYKQIDNNYQCIHVYQNDTLYTITTKIKLTTTMLQLRYTYLKWEYQYFDTIEQAFQHLFIGVL